MNNARRGAGGPSCERDCTAAFMLLRDTTALLSAVVRQ